MRYVAHLSPGPAWIKDKPASEQDRLTMAAHLLSMRRRYDEGSLLFGGPFISELGGIAILEAGSPGSASSIISADPAVVAGVMVFRISAVNTLFDAFAKQAWSPSKST